MGVLKSDNGYIRQGKSTTNTLHALQLSEMTVLSTSLNLSAAVVLSRSVCGNSLALDEIHFPALQAFLFQLTSQSDSRDLPKTVPDFVARLNKLPVAARNVNLAPRIGDLLLVELERVETVDDMYGLVDSIRKSIASGKDENDDVDSFKFKELSSNAIFGTFCRAVCLSFDDMLFEDVSRLLNELKQNSSKPVITADFARTFSNSMLSDEVKSTHETPYSIQQTCNEVWEMLPDQVRIHYVTFLNSMNSREFEQARESLYLYFDYAAAHLGPGGERPQKVMFQYALMDLASLHEQFGHVDEALLAVNEAMTLARYNNDLDCLHKAVKMVHRLQAGNVADDELSLSSLSEMAQLKHKLDLVSYDSVTF